MILDLLTADEMSVAAVKRLYAEYRSRHRFAEDVLAALEQLDAEHVWRATSLLHLLAKEGMLEGAHVTRLTGQAEGFRAWIPRLNYCQTLALAPCPKESADDALAVLLECATDSHATTRAWAYSAMVRLPLNSQDRKRVAKVIAAGRRERAKCIQARYRRDPLLK